MVPAIYCDLYLALASMFIFVHGFYSLVKE
jgi:hypothetical protein